MNLLHPTSDMMESWRKTWQAPLSSFCPRWWRWTWSWLLSCIFNTIGHCLLLPHHCQVFKLPPAGAGEEEDHRAWLLHRALNHPCRLLLLQGCQKKLPFLSTSLLHRRHPGSYTLWKGAWFSSTSLPFLSNTRISSQSTLPGIYTWNALVVNDKY